MANTNDRGTESANSLGTAPPEPGMAEHGDYMTIDTSGVYGVVLWLEGDWLDNSLRALCSRRHDDRCPCGGLWVGGTCTWCEALCQCVACCQVREDSGRIREEWPDLKYEDKQRLTSMAQELLTQLRKFG